MSNCTGGDSYKASCTSFRDAEKFFRRVTCSVVDDSLSRLGVVCFSNCAVSRHGNDGDIVEHDVADVVSQLKRSVVGDADSMLHIRVCYTCKSLPGLVVFPQALSSELQVSLCRAAILSYGDASLHPNLLSTRACHTCHTSCYVPPMRWSTLGFTYDWTNKTYARSSYSPFPPLLRVIASRLVQCAASASSVIGFPVDPCTYAPQAAIVNYYPVQTTLMCHQDVSEESMSQPLVSLSLGCSAIFLMGGHSRDTVPHAFLLQSGDVAMFLGPARAAFHSVPRIFDDCPAHLTLPDDAMSAQERASYVQHAYVHGVRSTQAAATATSRVNTALDPGMACSVVDKSTMSASELERYWRLCMRHMRVNISVRQVYADECSYLYT